MIEKIKLRIKNYFISRLTRDEIISLLIEKSFFGDDGGKILEEGYDVWSMASRNSNLKEWIQKRKNNLLKYSLIHDIIGDVRKILAEYDLIISMMGSSVEIPKSNPIDTSSDIKTSEDFMKEWNRKKAVEIK